MARELRYTVPMQVMMEPSEYEWLQREATLGDTDMSKIVRMLIRKYKAKRTKA